MRVLAPAGFPALQYFTSPLIVAAGRLMHMLQISAVAHRCVAGAGACLFKNSRDPETSVLNRLAQKTRPRPIERQSWDHNRRWPSRPVGLFARVTPLSHNEFSTRTQSLRIFSLFLLLATKSCLGQWTLKR